MKKNVGTIDKVIRIALAAVIAVLYFTQQISGTAAVVLGIVAIMLVLTSIISFCPLYAIIGVSTVEKKDTQAPPKQ